MGCADLETRSPGVPTGMARCVPSGPDVSSTLKLLMLLKLSSSAQASGSREEQQGWSGFFFLFLWVGILSSGFYLLCPQGPGARCPWDIYSSLGCQDGRVELWGAGEQGGGLTKPGFLTTD